ncbi:MAG: hypothetical protein GTN81_14310 [Proteobacteria bacterium]|nr:hypothetical protein [Pseudomonadota bacterium]
MRRGIAFSLIGLSLAFLTLAGAEARELVKFGGDVVVEEGTTVDKAVAIGGNVTVNGVIERDAVAVGGSIFLGPQAVVGGDAVSVGGTIEKGEGAQVRGDVVEVNIPRISSIFGLFSQAKGREWLWTFRIISFLGLLALAVVLVTVIPKPFDSVLRTVEENILRSILWGLVGLVIIIFLAVSLVVSLVGIPLIPLEFMLVGCAFLVGYVAMAQLIGSKMATAAKKPHLNVIWATMLGLIVLWVIGWVPVLGWLVKGAALFLGFGGVVAGLLGAAKSHREKKKT